jgi:hypothetical protein
MEVVMFCPQCGAKNDLEKKFCRSCGYSLVHTQLVLEGHLEETIEKLKKSESIIRKGIKTLLIFILLAIFLAAFADPFEVTLGAPLYTKIAISHWPTILGIGLAFGIPAILIGYMRLRRANRLLPIIGEPNPPAIRKSDPQAGLYPSIPTNKMIDANQPVLSSIVEDPTLKIKQPDTEQ